MTQDRIIYNGQAYIAKMMPFDNFVSVRYEDRSDIIMADSELFKAVVAEWWRINDDKIVKQSKTDPSTFCIDDFEFTDAQKQEIRKIVREELKAMAGEETMEG